MKKSERRDQLRLDIDRSIPAGDYHSSWINVLADNMLDREEARGVTWDPEEEPLPDKLEFFIDGDGWLADGRPIMDWPKERKRVVLVEAARLYTSRKRLREIIEGEPCVAPMEHAQKIQALLLAILDGKEPAS